MRDPVHQSTIGEKTNMRYRISEVQNAHSHRDPAADAVIEARSLTAAKRAAKRAQMFRGTVLIVRSGNGAPLSSWEDGRWIDA